MYKFTGFTQKANDALNAAVSAAEELGHAYIGSEHILLGLLKENGGMAYTALSARKITADAVEKIIRASVGILNSLLCKPSFTSSCRDFPKMFDSQILEGFSSNSCKRYFTSSSD